ncbi:hypothetical protein Cgig2_005276 [Carnegiea gigantea]|uniref:Uncharacterized protein n=1 Tax=Carnegiea gigantea TaxID=171969 RepID=A0A9Q1GWU2_9CARY|nr:hypothetical protein Cgig2_005276 [Carnegiea gigantea]
MEEREGIIEESTPLLNPNPNPNPNPKPSDSDKGIANTTASSAGTNTAVKKSVRTKVPEVEVHLYRQGKGPIAVFKSTLGGWDQDQLEVRDILDKYGFKSIYAFNPNGPGRTVPIRFHPRNGRSMLAYRDGAVIYIDGEPKAYVERCVHFGKLISIDLSTAGSIMDGAVIQLKQARRGPGWIKDRVKGHEWTENRAKQ